MFVIENHILELNDSWRVADAKKVAAAAAKDKASDGKENSK